MVLGLIQAKIPKIRTRDSNKPPWIKKDLLDAIKRKKTLWRKCKKSNDPKLFQKFRKERQRIKNWIRAARKSYLSQIANEINEKPKRFWSFFSYESKRKSIPASMIYNSISITDDRDKAEAFNNFFLTAFKDHSSCNISDYNFGEVINDCLDDINISVEEIANYLRTLNCSKASGPDNIPSRILKECASSLAPSITAFINCSLRNGLYLSAWKEANISPIFKKDKREQVTNYRQISLLPVISKIQEKCVATRFTQHIYDYIHKSQHGFQKGLSCVTQLLQVLHEVGATLDKGGETDMIYLDFAKAFDSVCHYRLFSQA